MHPIIVILLIVVLIRDLKLIPGNGTDFNYKAI